MKTNTFNLIAKSVSLTGFVASVMLAANPVQAATVALQSFSGGSNFPAFNGTNQTIGWSFTANDNLTVSSLGVWDMTPSNPLSQSHQVGLWSSTGTLLSSVIVQTNSLLTGEFRYESITPISLTSGSTYFIGSDITSPFSDNYRSGATSVTIAPEITFLNAARNASSGGFSFPSTTTSNNNGRFGPNFQFTTSTAVPEPSMVISLMGFGTFALCSRFRRYSK